MEINGSAFAGGSDNAGFWPPSPSGAILPFQEMVVAPLAATRRTKLSTSRIGRFA